MSYLTLTQFSVPVPNRPGSLREITKVLSRANINVLGIIAEAISDSGFVRFIAEPEGAVSPALKKAGFQVFETPAISLELTNQPGTLSMAAENFAKSGINIISVYGTACGNQGARIVFVVDQPDKAKSVLERILK